MKQRLADYVADFLSTHGVTDVFSVVGGGAMHLNDALGHHEGLHVTYNHHEQACAIAAEAYARLENRIAAVCVTTGPGGTNALTGVVGGWLDSIPMFIISGQVRYDTTARYALSYTETPLRAMGDQEYDIVKSVTPMTKLPPNRPGSSRNSRQSPRRRPPLQSLKKRLLPCPKRRQSSP